MVAGPVVSTLDDVLPSVGIVVDPSVSPIELEPPSVVLLGEDAEEDGGLDVSGVELLDDGVELGATIKTFLSMTNHIIEVTM